jgi:hypothetical protein
MRAILATAGFVLAAPVLFAFLSLLQFGAHGKRTSAV